MVRVGFVVEGACERLFIESESFRAFANGIGIAVCDPVVDVEGGGNLCERNLSPYILDCQEKAQPDHIIVLTDLDCEPCITETKNRIGTKHDVQVVVARQALESWFLADDRLTKAWFGVDIPFPEEILGKPWDYLKQLAKLHNVRGPGSTKLGFVRKKVLSEFGFSIERAANHANCPSATYFVDRLKRLTISGSSKPV